MQEGGQNPKKEGKNSFIACQFKICLGSIIIDSKYVTVQRKQEGKISIGGQNANRRANRRAKSEKGGQNDKQEANYIMPIGGQQEGKLVTSVVLAALDSNTTEAFMPLINTKIRAA